MGSFRQFESRRLPGFSIDGRDGGRGARSRDPNLDHPAVKLYQEYCRLRANHIQRREIVVTVKNDKRDLALFEQVLHVFMSEGCNPKRVDWLLDRFETALRAVQKGGYR